MEWKELPGHKGYFISTEGKVRGPNGDIKLKLNHGYEYFDIRFNVHRAVMLTFHPDGKDRLVRHMDGDRSNNHIDNLKWGTYKENSMDSVRHGTCAFLACNFKVSEYQKPGAENHQAKLSEEEARDIVRRSKTEKIVNIWKDYQQVSRTTVRRIARGLRYAHLQNQEL